MFSAPRSGALALLTVASCQVPPIAGPPGSSPALSSDAVDYGSQMRLLFDDELGGLSLGGDSILSTPEASKLLSRRILEANAVTACQIQTITEGSAGDVTYARLEFRGNGQSLSYERQDECPVISVSSQSYSFQLIHHASNALIGKTVVLFLKKFNESGHESIHWHGEPDGARIREEVKRIGSPIR